jgi:hypothetical protein
MIHLRAGIIYAIANGRINKSHLEEILHWSKYTKVIESLYRVYQIQQIETVGMYRAPVDFDVKEQFGDHFELVKKYLDIISIHIIAYYFYEYCYVVLENPIIAWSKNTRGHQEEQNTLSRFNDVYGYSITTIKRKEYIIPGTDIMISGTPDGEVQNSPGGIFDGYLVEIKYQNNKSNDYVVRNKCQIAAYSKIFNKSVMLIVFSNDYFQGNSHNGSNHYNVYRYTKETLSKFWESDVVPKLISNINKIKNNLFIVDPSEIPKYLAYIS